MIFSNVIKWIAYRPLSYGPYSGNCSHGGLWNAKFYAIIYVAGHKRNQNLYRLLEIRFLPQSGLWYMFCLTTRFHAERLI